jgi:hypothetical protein
LPQLAPAIENLPDPFDLLQQGCASYPLLYRAKAGSVLTTSACS